MAHVSAQISQLHMATAFHFLISKRGALPAAAAFFFGASSAAGGAASAISTSSDLFSLLPAIVDLVIVEC